MTGDRLKNTAMQAKADLFAPDLVQLSEQARALVRPARWTILQVLAARQGCICGELADEIPLAQSSVSRHLKALKEAGLVKGTVDGPRVGLLPRPRSRRRAAWSGGRRARQHPGRDRFRLPGGDSYC